MLRGAAGFVAAALLCAYPILAQTPQPRSLSGTVLLDSVAVADVPITLHRVTPDGSGPVGELVTGPAGEFRFALPPSDSAAFEVFFVTAEYRSVRYFGQPVHGAARPDNYTVAVFDTASSLPGAIRVARRDIVLLPETAGGWEANEIIRLHNSADRTLVSSGGLPTWELRLPEGVTDFQAGEGELTAAEMSLMGDRALLLASLTPGDREIFIRYRIPLDLERALLAIDTPTDTLNVFVGEPSPSIEVTGMATTKLVDVQGERFVQYGTTDLAAGEQVALSWDAPVSAPVSPEVAGVVVAVLVLLVGSWFGFRGGRSAKLVAGDAPTAG